MGKVILLSGAPGTGKSTLRDALAAPVHGLEHFDYGQLLLRRKQREGLELSYEQLRERSAAIISPEDIASTDDWVIAEIGALRQKKHVMIDSHALTRESYGFRAIPFLRRQVEQDLSLDLVLALRCAPDTLIARVRHDPRGRRELTTELAREIQAMQESLCITYSVLSACPLYVIDTTHITEQELQMPQRNCSTRSVSGNAGNYMRWRKINRTKTPGNSPTLSWFGNCLWLGRFLSSANVSA